MMTISAKVENIVPLTDSIIQLILTPEEYMDYQAGQYLQVKIGETLLSYSIANAPLGSRKYELHIRHSRTNPCLTPLLASIKSSGVVSITLPLGFCHLGMLQKEKPILFIARGTGFAPIHAMIEQLLVTDSPPPFALYWGAYSKNDLYMAEKVRQWQTHATPFLYFSEHPAEEQQPNLLTTLWQRHALDLLQYQVVLAGPFDKVFATRDALLQKGVLLQNIYSDAFDVKGG